jgi:hypothetical protein
MKNDEKLAVILKFLFYPIKQIGAFSRAITNKTES